MLPYNVYTNDACLDCYVTSVGRHRCPKGNKNSLFLLDKTVIHYIESGKGIFTMNGKTYQLQAGDAFYIPLRVRGDYCADDQDPWNYTWIYFQRNSGDRFFEDLGLSPENPVYTTKEPERLTKLFQSLHDTNKNTYHAISDIFTTLSTMVKTNKNPVPRRKKSGDDIITICESYIRHNSGRKLSVNDLCAHVKIDRTYLYRLFRSHLGMGPQEYIARTKLEIAKQLLLESPLSIAEAGQMTGFDDPFTFSKQFKKYYGLSPRNYVKERKKHETI